MTGVPDSPFKGLAAFDDSELDALFFFGREPEVDAVAANVLANRLTVLYGPSGVGKSSLLGAGVARRLREQSDAPVVVHGAWAEDPAGGLIAAVRAECGDLGATAGVVDTIAAVGGELYLLLDQFEEYVLYHGADGPLNTALPDLLRRPGLRVNVLIAIRDDALAELDELTPRIPELFANLIRLDRLDRDEGRAAILGPLARYSELSGVQFTAEDALVEAVLDEASTANGVEAPYLQLVLERLWEQERADGSHTLRLETFHRIGGSRAVVHEHVHRALEQLPVPEQEATVRVMRQLVTPSGRKVSHEADDLAEYAAVEPAQLRHLLEELGRRRIVRAIDGTPGAPRRYEIFHDVLGPPLLAWQQEHQLRSERAEARRQRRRLQAIAAASLTALVLVALLAVFAFVQRSHARAQAQRAQARELASRALGAQTSDPQKSVRLALRAARLAAGPGTTSVLRSSLLAMREERVFRLGGTIVAASYAPRGDQLLLASSNGRLDTFDGTLHTLLPRGPALTTAVWSSDGQRIAAGTVDGRVLIWGRQGSPLAIRTPFSITSLAFSGNTLLIASGAAVRLMNVETGAIRTFPFGRNVDAAALNPDGSTFAVALHHAKNTTAELLDARTGGLIRVLPESGIHSFTFSPNGRLLATGSYDVTARLWDASTGRLLHVLGHKGHVLQETFSRDGATLVTASSDGAAYVWDVATGARELLLVGSIGGINAAAFSPDGSEIVTGSADTVARIYQANNGLLVAPLSGAANAVTSVGFDPSGTTVVTASSDGTARLWDALPAGTLTTIATENSPVRSFWLGRNLVTVAGRVAQERTASGDVVHTQTLDAPIVATASHGSDFALLDADGVVTTSWTPSFRLGGGSSRTTAVALEPDGTLLRGESNGEIIRGPREVTKVDGRVLTLSVGGSRFLVRTADELSVYTDTGQIVSTIHATTDHAILSPGGLGVATTEGPVAELWDATTGKLLQTLRGHSSPITALAYAPNGLHLVTVSYDHTGIVYSTRTGSLVRRLIGHFFPIYSVAYSPDGRWIVTASQFTAGLWNATTGQLMFYVGRTSAPLTGAAFDSAGETILTGSLDGTARVYDCQVCAPLPQLEQLAASRLRRLSR